MILSNEPGYYKTGEYGIRIENLVLVVPGEAERRAGEEAARLRDADLRADRPQSDRDGDALGGRARWVDDYHAEVLRIVGPQLEGEAKAWLEAACAPL